MEWFRFYNGAINDRKVQQLPAELFKAWVNILCLASANNKGGELPALDDMAFALRMSDEQTTDTLNALERAGLIDRDEAGNLAPHNWHGRQRKSDDVALRVQDHREKKRGKGGNGPRNTPPAGPGNKGGNTPCNVTGNGSVTPHAGAHAGEIEQIQRDSERKTDAGTSTKPQPKSKPTVAADDPIVDADLPNYSLSGPIGKNDAASVAMARVEANKIDPSGEIEVRLAFWLANHPAAFVVEAIHASRGKETPHSYAARIIARGPQALPPGRPAPPPRHELKPWVPPVLPDSMFDLTPEQEAALARRDAMAARGKTA